MNNNLKNLAMRSKITILVLLGAFFFLANTVDAQNVLTGQKFVKSRGASEYVIPSGDVAIQKPALSRGGCLIKFDNWTGYYVDLWIDKVYKGRLNPWENSQVLLPEGYTEVYCRTMGETYQWQSSGKCNEEFLLKLEEGSSSEQTSSDSDEF